MSKPNYSASDERLMKACGVATDEPKQPCPMCEAHEAHLNLRKQEIATLQGNEVRLYARIGRLETRDEERMRSIDYYRTRMWMAVMVAAFLVAHALYVAQH